MKHSLCVGNMSSVWEVFWIIKKHSLLGTFADEIIWNYSFFRTIQVVFGIQIGFPERVINQYLICTDLIFEYILDHPRPS